MPTPRKSAAVIEQGKKAHKTKSELASRKRAEEAALTGIPLIETSRIKKNALAHAEFQRMRNLLKKIKKHDDIYRNVVNRYCMLCAECMEFVDKRESIYSQLVEFGERKDDLISKEELTWKEAYRIEADMQANMLGIDKQIQTKRRMMLDIEKENGWTVKASIQTIPVTPAAKSNPLLEALKDG